MKSRPAASLAAWLGLSVGLVSASVLQEQAQAPRRSLVQRPLSSGSALEREPNHGSEDTRAQPARFPLEFRSLDGRGNNLRHPGWGAAGAVLLRLVPADYADGVGAPAGAGRASARELSNQIAAQRGSIPNAGGASDFVWMWGQFLDHDIDETPVAAPCEPFDIQVPTGDAWFDPYASGVATIPLDRSAHVPIDGVRQQLNLISAFIDASNVYGCEQERALELRTLDGSGRLRTSPGNLLPFNERGFPNAPSDDARFFLAGDIRANEQVALTALHTLFVREHNFWARRLATLGLPDGETVYQVARALVGAELQAITYREFLPVLLGPDALPPYRGYQPELDPSIANAFATAGYRVGHTMLSPTLLRVQADGSTHPAGDLPLASAFFDPGQITEIGLEPYLRGLARQRAQEVDPRVVDAVRNFLFGPPGAGGLDLAALNIQRGRDHGLPAYNDLRQALVHSRAQCFAEVTSDAETQQRLAGAYSHVDEIDAWVGLLCEEHVPGALVGPTLRSLLAEQFRRLREGDRFFYRSYLPAGLVHFVESQSLADIIRRNTRIGAELPDDLFHVQ